MTSETTQTYNEYHTNSSAGTTWPFDAISEPGTYICQWNGYLVRVPEDAVSPGRSPKINMIGKGPLMVTKISDNPYVPLTKAKLLASNFDLNVNF
jgi:hypothetical protein